MTPLEVAKYIRSFQKVQALQLAKTRMIAQGSRYQDNVAELIRLILPKGYFQLLRRTHGYNLMYTGPVEAVPFLSRALRVALFHGLVLRVSRGVTQPSVQIGEPTEELFDAALETRPVLLELERLRQNLPPGAVIPEPEPEPVEPPITATQIAPPPRPEELAAQMAARVQGRPTVQPEAVEPPDDVEPFNPEPDDAPTAVGFESEGARRFAEALARANTRRRS